ncbi:hypothetical protein EJ06DRAFT_468074 [Trichodelitschia bisporula]|uniref:Uncharacterized protein n=1 Tax=Trichodelitschia bisporula TaxID=703511 RepID=A0A6G1IB03_9PEZI|nr:hypothetical protein EJ06DRAFT_468074 [Trichodelitschia bisporula]
MKRVGGAEGANPETTEFYASHKRRKITVYDAVAGRVGSNGFLPPRPIYASTRDTKSSSSRPVPADEVLFRRPLMPDRYGEDDVYSRAYRQLDRPEQIPESDLTKALHQYASDFYSLSKLKHREVSYGSLDETAMLAMGILIEEAAEMALGETGHSSLIEGESGRGGYVPVTWNGQKWTRSAFEARRPRVLPKRKHRNAEDIDETVPNRSEHSHTESFREYNSTSTDKVPDDGGTITGGDDKQEQGGNLESPTDSDGVGY